MSFKSGFVAVIGRPNVGKSTLLNKIIGEKISIVSDKAQTTRHRIQLIYTRDDGQIIFLDTPGIQSPKNKLGDYMLGVSKSTLADVDIILFLVEPGQFMGRQDKDIKELLKFTDTPIVLVLNKIDLLEESEIEELIKKYNDEGYEDVQTVSALKGEGIDGFIEHLMDLLPEGPQYFPDDMITDQPERVIVAELIREKAMLNLREEIPHGIFVEVETMKKREDKDLVDISATIYTERNSHKGMVIGKGGKMLKKIGQEARKDIESLLGSQIHLQLWVKVADKWRDEDEHLRGFGYR